MNVRLPAITRLLRLVISGGSNQYDSELGKVTLANLDKANLDGANLSGANLANANLAVANLTGANLDGVIGADFSDARNVPEKYLKR